MIYQAVWMNEEVCKDSSPLLRKVLFNKAALSHFRGMTKSLNVWRVCYINEQKRIYLDGAPVQNRTIRLSILAAIDGNRLPLTGWIRQENGTWEFDKQGPFKSYF